MKYYTEVDGLALLKRKVIAALMDDDRELARKLLQRCVTDKIITSEQSFQLYQQCDQQAHLNNQDFEKKNA